MVARGDTLAVIALRHHVPVEDITAANGLPNPNHITTGQQLHIPPPAAHALVIQPGTTLTGYAHHTGLTVAELMALNPHITHPDRIHTGGRLTTAASP